MIQYMFSGIFILLCILGYYDVKHHKIPNKVTYPFFIISITYALITAHWTSMLIGAIGSLALFYWGTWGGGDAKLFSSLLAYLPLTAATLYASATLLISGVYVLLARLFFRKKEVALAPIYALTWAFVTLWYWL